MPRGNRYTENVSSMFSSTQVTNLLQPDSSPQRRTQITSSCHAERVPCRCNSTCVSDRRDTLGLWHGWCDRTRCAENAPHNVATTALVLVVRLRLEGDTTATKSWRGRRRDLPRSVVHPKTVQSVPSSDRWYRVHACSDAWHIPSRTDPDAVLRTGGKYQCNAALALTRRLKAIGAHLATDILTRAVLYGFVRLRQVFVAFHLIRIHGHIGPDILFQIPLQLVLLRVVNRLSADFTGCSIQDADDGIFTTHAPLPVALGGM